MTRADTFAGKFDWAKSNQMLLALGMLKLFLVSFLVVMFTEGGRTYQAHASEITCTGNNLLDELKKNDEDAYSRVVSAGSKTLNGNGLLWKIEKTGTPASFVYGTMHMADPRISTFKPKLARVLEMVDTVAVENTDALDPVKAQQAMVQFQNLTLNLENKKLEEEIPAELVEKLKAIMTERGVPTDMMNLFQPWVVSSLIAAPVCEMQLKANGGMVLDGLIAKYAEDNGKNLISLETLEEQFTAISSIPREFHITSMKEMLTLGGDKIVNMNETMRQLYLEERISLFMPLARELTPDSFKVKGSTEFQELLIDKRNVVMSERSKEILQTGNALIAVGALHLPGPTGLVEQFKKLGYQVTPVTN